MNNDVVVIIEVRGGGCEKAFLLKNQKSKIIASIKNVSMLSLEVSSSTFLFHVVQEHFTWERFLSKRVMPKWNVLLVCK